MPLATSASELSRIRIHSNFTFSQVDHKALGDSAGVYVILKKNAGSQVVKDEFWEYGRKMAAGGPPKQIKLKIVYEKKAWNLCSSVKNFTKISEAADIGCLLFFCCCILESQTLQQHCY